MNKQKKRTYVILFVALTSVIFLATYAVYTFSANIFQSYLFLHHFEPFLFARENVIAVQISVIIPCIWLLKSLQHLRRQRLFMMVLISFLSIELYILKSYPAIEGLCNAIFDLTEPWRQLYAPPAFRATIEGLTEGFTGFFDVASVFTENSFAQHLGRFHHIMVVFLMFCALLFWVLSRKIEKNADEKKVDEADEPKQAVASLSTLVSQYPHIFMACLFSGFNTAVFSYTLLFAKELLPNGFPQDYQYAIYIGSIIVPIFIGRVADKKGIFSILVFTGWLLILTKLMMAGFFLTNIKIPIMYYVLGFIEAGLSAGVVTIGVAFVGERLRTQGIFRAFALSDLFFNLGLLIAGYIYKWFSGHFGMTKLVMALLDVIELILISQLWYFYHKEKKVKLDPKQVLSIINRK